MDDARPAGPGSCRPGRPARPRRRRQWPGHGWPPTATVRSRPLALRSVATQLRCELEAGDDDDWERPESHPERSSCGLGGGGAAFVAAHVSRLNLLLMGFRWRPTESPGQGPAGWASFLEPSFLSPCSR
ncbi:hypothetical protein SETIT_6G236900v2 [Setaria italica]|uniref:Uncharacterized protein n=2 Tax=Setaria TaxID=4554 RepID=A0A368RPM5_SETIT|nr:hypothetical protein SETIT_6G236900v2 [Setaria italica]